MVMRINLAPRRRLGPVFDAEATGFARYVPRRPWWPVLPVLVVGAPVIVSVVLVHRFSERLTPRIA